MRSKANPKKFSRRRFKRIRLFFLLTITFIAIAFVYVLFIFDDKMLPSVLAVTEVETKSIVNTAIDNCINKTMKQMNLSSNDFYYRIEGTNGRMEVFTVNTLLVNELCSTIAVEITNELKEMDKQSVALPIGAILGIEALANFGPKYPITVMPLGSALVDYHTSFDSAGINQINFQIWLNVESAVRVVNPFQKQNLVVSRKVALVNSVISGEIPSMMFPGMNESGGEQLD